VDVSRCPDCNKLAPGVGGNVIGKLTCQQERHAHKNMARPARVRRARHTGFRAALNGANRPGDRTNPADAARFLHWGVDNVGHDD
jgi:sRNA-binding protein